MSFKKTIKIGMAMKKIAPWMLMVHFFTFTMENSIKEKYDVLEIPFKWVIDQNNHEWQE